MKILLIVIVYVSTLLGYTICPKNQQECENGSIHFLDTQSIFSLDKHISEFSALVLDGKTLYILSDKGRLLHYKLLIQDKKIKQLKYQKSFFLKDKNGKRLKKAFRDSEGMSRYGKHLLISFEGKNRVEEYDIYGNRYRGFKLNKKLRKNSDYVNENSGLESVAYSNIYGIITAPERPLNKKNKHKIYSKDFIWKFDADGSISDMVFIDSHHLMVLLREYGTYASQKNTTLLSIDLSSCIDKSCKVQELAKLHAQDGWKLDNFEGVTKVGDNLYLMVSDDNNSFFQKTLLVLFEIIQ